MEVNIGTLQKLIYQHVIKQKSFFIHGTMGIGKSDTVRFVAKQIAAERKMPYSEGQIEPGKYNISDVRMPQLDPSDLRGIPFPDNGNTRWLVPNWLPKEGTEGILFLDEINLAPPSIQAAAYQLILDRRLGDYVLPDGWAVVAAGNRSSDRANVFPLGAPLNNRFGHCELRIPTEEEWRDWAVENNIRPDIIAFMAFKPSLLFKFSKDSKDDAFPTPRTWATASHMLEGVEDPDMEFNLVASWVGEAAALEFQGFQKLRKKVNIADILKNPKKVKELSEVGLKYSLISGLADKYKSDKKMMNPILAVVEQMDAEFGVFLLRLMKGMHPKFTTDLVESPNWPKLFKEYHKYIL
jgi:hypothetical protein